jgi:hypothetical protein
MLPFCHSICSPTALRAFCLFSLSASSHHLSCFRITLAMFILPLPTDRSVLVSFALYQYASLGALGSRLLLTALLLMTMGAVTLSDVGGTGSIPTWQVCGRGSAT